LATQDFKITDTSEDGFSSQKRPTKAKGKPMINPYGSAIAFSDYPFPGVKKYETAEY
jgi:hypothetical protein